VELEARSKLAISVGYIQNRLSDAQSSLVADEQEIQRLKQEVNSDSLALPKRKEW
jgi:hypothetical protein